ncbi:MAG: glycosyltransferase [Chloroflexota bacterium]
MGASPPAADDARHAAEDLVAHAGSRLLAHARHAGGARGPLPRVRLPGAADRARPRGGGEGQGPSGRCDLRRGRHRHREQHFHRPASVLEVGVPAARAGVGQARRRRGLYQRRARGRLRAAARPQDPTLVVLNTPPRWSPPTPRPNLVREATGLPASTRIVMYLGRLSPHRGLEEAAEAVAAVDDAALVLVGFGVLADEERSRAADPRFAGRHFTLPAVHPDEVPAWTASADVTLIALPPTSLNQRLTTPNKIWESLTGGTPVVVGRENTTIRKIVEADRLGAVVDPRDPPDFARGLREVLDAPEADRAAMRARCLAVAQERYNWESTSAGYIDLVNRLLPERPEARA